MKHHRLLSLILLSSSLLILISVFSFDGSSVLFVGSLIAVVSILLNQFRLLVIAYIEELFTSLQSERTFPVTEAADTFAGILGGVAIALLLGPLSISGLLLLSAVALLIPIPALLIYGEPKSELSRHDDPAVAHGGHVSSTVGPVLGRIRRSFSDPVYFPYLRVLAAVVFLQWFLFNILEYVYTVAIYENASSVAADFGSGFEHAFIHDLGQLFALFSGLALVFQLVIGSRLISALGVVNSVIVHALVTFVGALSLLFGLSFNAAIFVKNNFTVTNVLFNNAYHSSYYAIPSAYRSLTREILEGVVRPSGALLGTVFLILSTKLLNSYDSNLFLTGLLLVAPFIIILLGLKLRSLYTAVVRQNLLESDDVSERLLALDVLSQRGHVRNHKLLRESLFGSVDDKLLRKFSVKSLLSLDDHEALMILVDFLESDQSYACRRSILIALSRHEGRMFKGLPIVCQYRVVSAIRKIYLHSSDSESLFAAVGLLRHFPSPMSLDLLFPMLDSKSALPVRLEAMRILFSFGGSGVTERLRPFLFSEIPDEKVVAAIGFYNDKKLSGKSRSFLQSLFSASDDGSLALAAFAAGELKLRRYKKFLHKGLASDSVNLKMHSALALGKLQLFDGVNVLVDLLHTGNAEMRSKLKRRLAFVPLSVRKAVESGLKERLQHAYQSSLSNMKGAVSPDLLARMHEAYELHSWSGGRLQV